MNTGFILLFLETSEKSAKRLICFRLFWLRWLFINFENLFLSIISYVQLPQTMVLFEILPFILCKTTFDSSFDYSEVFENSCYFYFMLKFFITVYEKSVFSWFFAAETATFFG